MFLCPGILWLTLSPVLIIQCLSRNNVFSSISHTPLGVIAWSWGHAYPQLNSAVLHSQHRGRYSVGSQSSTTLDVFGTLDVLAEASVVLLRTTQAYCLQQNQDTFLPNPIQFISQPTVWLLSTTFSEPWEIAQVFRHRLWDVGDSSHLSSDSV
jgi:hypothetical protein